MNNGSTQVRGEEGVMEVFLLELPGMDGDETPTSYCESVRQSKERIGRVFTVGRFFRFAM